MNQRELDIAWKKWKKDDPVAYNKFEKYSKRQLRRQREIDRYGYAMPRRKAKLPITVRPVECELYKTYEEDHMCDLCHIDTCPHCKERLT